MYITVLYNALLLILLEYLDVFSYFGFLVISESHGVLSLEGQFNINVFSKNSHCLIGCCLMPTCQYVSSNKRKSVTTEAPLWHALSFCGVSWFKPSGARPVWSSFNEGSDKGEDERAVMRLIPWLEPALGLLLLVTLATDPLSNLVTHGMCAV